MIATSFDSQSVFILTEAPDWKKRVTLGLKGVADEQRGLTGREARRPLGDSLRCSLKWTALLARDEINALRNALQAMGDEPVLCAAWPFALRGADWADSAYSSQLTIGWLDDWSDYEIGETLADPTAWDHVAPLLWGKLNAVPDVAPNSPVYATVQFEFIEDAASEFGLVPEAVAWTNGPALPDTSTPKLFPFTVNWKAQKSGAAEVVVDRKPLGPSRQRADVFYPQNADRPQQGGVTLASYAEIAKLLRWIYDRRGTAQAGYVTNDTAVAALAVFAAAGANSITLDDATQLGANRYLELARGDVREVKRVSAIAANVCTLTSNLAHDWPAGLTLVRLAMLARFATNEFSIEFRSPALASATLAWRELPAEYSVFSGETRGTTLGALTLQAWLYVITLDWNGTTETHYFTSFERDLDVTSGGVITYTSRPAEHSELRQSLALQDDEITVKVRWWEDCPLRKFLPNSLDAKVTLEIFSCDVDGSAGSNVAQFFGGEVTAVDFTGPQLTLHAAGANALFDRRFPRILMQRTCNHALFDARCGLDRADWSFACKVYSVAGKVLTVDNLPGSPPAGFGFAHWFALGYVERNVAGKTVRHLIFDSAALASGRIALTLGSPPLPAPAVGDDLTIIPGCDNLPATCKAYDAGTNPTGKFDNYDPSGSGGFGGFPFMPDTNPSLTPISDTTSAIGKK